MGLNNIKTISKEEYLNLSPKERKSIDEELISLRDKQIEFDVALKQKESEKKREKIKYQIYEYEDFSVHNINNHLSIWTKDEQEGYILFLSDKIISEVELYGLKSIIIDKFNKMDQIDISAALLKGEYNKDTDNVYLKHGWVDNISQKICNKEILKYKKYVYGVHWKKWSRNNKSLFWKLRNKRTCCIVDYTDSWY